MKNITTKNKMKMAKGKTEENPFRGERDERECERCNEPFYSTGENICEDCAYKELLMINGYSEGYADELLKTHVRFENQLRKLLEGNIKVKSHEKKTITEAASILVKSYCKGKDTGWIEGYRFEEKRPREGSMKIEVPKVITFKPVETRKDLRVVICDRCEGTGKVRVYNENPGYQGPGEEQCPICDGSGRREMQVNFCFKPYKPYVSMDKPM